MKRKKVLATVPNKPKGRGKVVTAQVTEGILVLNFWEDKKLEARYCMNTETSEYETYFVKSNTWEQRRIQDTWERTWDSSCYKLGQCTKLDSEADRKVIAKALKLKQAHTDVFYDIDFRQSDRNCNIRERARESKETRIRNMMSLVPAIPLNFKEWIFQLAAGMDYAFYNKEKEKWVCTACKNWFKETQIKRENKKKIIHNTMITCPCCKKDIQAKTRQKKVEKITHALLLQNMDKDRSVARHFNIDIYWNNEGVRSVTLDETVRTILLRNDKKYACKLYYAQELWHGGAGGWVGSWGKRNPQQKKIHKEYLYPQGIDEALKDTVYEKWTGIFNQLAAAGQLLWYNNLMTGWRLEGLPNLIEYLYKGRFYRLLEETTENIWPLSGEYYGPLIIRGTKTVEEIFYIKDRQKINRIRDCNGGDNIVRWMQWSDKDAKKINDETLKWLTDEKVTRDDIYFISDRMSVQQIMNYVKKQQAGGYKGKSTSRVFEQWKDYLNMCKQLKKDVKDEMVYRPRELKRRHDECVEELNKRRILEAMKQNPQQRKQEARKMREKFPGAEEVLKEIKSKYEYENEEFLIIVPQKLMDIVTEGQALHHCVGNTERYFERIMNRETYICFLRRKSDPEVPFYTIEVEPGGTIRQHRSYLDEEPNIEEIRGFLKEWQKEIKKRISSKDKKYAEISKKKREQNIEELKRNKNLRVLKGLEEDFMEAI